YYRDLEEPRSSRRYGVRRRRETRPETGAAQDDPRNRDRRSDLQNADGELGDRARLNPGWPPPTKTAGPCANPNLRFNLSQSVCYLRRPVLDKQPNSCLLWKSKRQP